MKPFSSYTPPLTKLAALVAVGIFAATFVVAFPQVSHAQTIVPPSQMGLDPVETAQNVQGAVDSATQTVTETTGNILSGFGATLGNVLATASMGLLYAVFTLSTYILGLAGAVFNFTVVYFVFQFATTLGSSPGILAAWGVIRDFSNIILLFGFIFMGVITILDLHSYPVQKTVPKFIIYAVLLNFSLLGVSAIIDGANVLAATMYNQTMGGSGACVGFNLDGVSQASCIKNGLNVGIAGKIVEVSRVGTLLSGGSNLLQAAGDYSGLDAHSKTKFGLTIFLMIIFIIVATVVLLAGGVLLISRAVVLAFLMVASPILVIGLVIDPLKKQVEGFWKMLINNALFAPVFLLLIFVSLKIAEGVENKLTPIGTPVTNNLVDALTKGDVTYMGTIIVFILIIGFLIAALISAKQFSVKFGDQAWELGKGAMIQGFDSTLKVGGLPYSLLWGTAVSGGARNLARASKRSGFATLPVVGRPITKTLTAMGSSGNPLTGVLKPGVGAMALGAIGVKGAGGGGHGGGAGGHGADDEQTEYLKGLQKERTAVLTRLDTEKQALKERMDEAELKRENAAARGDAKEVAKQEKIKADLAAKIKENEAKKRELVFTKPQMEKYNRLTTAGKEEMDNLVGLKEQAQREKGTLDASLSEQERAIAELEARLAGPSMEGEERARAQAELLALHERSAKTRENIMAASTKIATLQSQIVERENKTALELAEADALTEKATKDFKSSVLREYTRKEEDFLDATSLYTPSGALLTGLSLGISQALRDETATRAAIATLRKEELKSGEDRAWEHLRHEITHAAEEKAAKAAKASAPTPQPAGPAPSGGGAPAGGGDHGGGH